jgi:hypothetical protein
LGKKAKSQGAKSGKYGGWGKITRLLVILCGFQGRVDGRVVVMKEPVVVAPKFRSFRRTLSLKHLNTSE